MCNRLFLLLRRRWRHGHFGIVSFSPLPAAVARLLLGRHDCSVMMTITGEIILLPLRSISMLIVGLVVFALALGAVLSPDMVAADYGAGWLYAQFGLIGIAGVLGVMGLVFAVWGVLGVYRALTQRRTRNDPTA